MNFKKTIAKSLVVAMALGMVPVANLQTAKAEEAAVTIKFDGATGIATSEKAKFWGIAKEVKKEGKDTVKIEEKYYKITNVQELDGEIDLYAALKGKAGVLAVGVNAIPDTNWKILSLPAAESTFKVYYSASDTGVKGFKPANALGGSYGYLFATKGKQPAEVNLDTDKEKIEVKLNDGNWKTLKEFFGNSEKLEKGDDKNVNKKLKVLGQSGSALSFRYKGTTDAWASKESKVKIATQAKAPNVKVDDVKNTTSIKKGMEWQTVDASNGTITVGAWTKYDAATPLPFATVKPSGENAKKDCALLVRTAATDKKIASKYTTVILKKAADAITLPDNLNGKTAIDTNVTFKLAVSYDKTKGAVLSNAGEKVYEYAFGKGTDTDDKLKWSTLKAATKDKKNAGAPSKPTVAKVPYKSFSETDTHFFLRVAGQKQKGNEMTLTSASAHKKVELEQVAQKFLVKTAGATATADSEITVTEATKTATIKMKPKTAGTFVVKSQLENAFKKGKNAKVKLKATGVKGVAVKAGELNDSGEFDLTIDVKNNTFKGDPSGTLTIEASYESVKNDKFVVTFEKKS